MKDILMNGGAPVTLCSSMLTLTDSKKPFKLDGDLLETITNFDFNVSQASPQDKTDI